MVVAAFRPRLIGYRFKKSCVLPASSRLLFKNVYMIDIIIRPLNSAVLSGRGAQQFGGGEAIVQSCGIHAEVSPGLLLSFYVPRILCNRREGSAQVR